MPGVTQASAPPDRITSASPLRINAAAYEIASVELVQPVDTTWLGPWRPKAMDNSLLSPPIVEVGIV